MPHRSRNQCREASLYAAGRPFELRYNGTTGVSKRFGDASPSIQYDEIARRGKELYEQRIRALVETQEESEVKP